jgi:hypothetical protein
MPSHRKKGKRRNGKESTLGKGGCRKKEKRRGKKASE